MGTIKVTNSSTGKAESKDLDMAALLTVTRSQLGAFMLRSDVFLDTEDVRVPAELEKEAKLEEIVKDSAIRIAGEAAPGEGQDSPGTKDPKNAAPITASDGVLKPEVLPEAQWAADHVGLMDGLNKDGEPVEDDKVYQLKVGQVRNLLKANRINLNKERAGSAPGFVDNDQGINWAARDAVQCTEVEVKPPDANRITSISFQYTEHVSRLHRTTTTEGKANVGVPEIFDVQGSYRTSRATRTDKRLVKEHKSFNHLIPKARVLFNADKVSLSDEFIGAIRNAVQEREPAPKLLQVLGTYGQFFASDMVLGGRLSYWTDKVIDETYTETQDQDRFQLVTKARATIDGLPVEGGADWGYGLDSGEKQAVIKQAATLILKIVGGNAATASPEKWIPTVAKYLNWKVVGFSQRSLVPTIDYLRDDDLRSKCVRILRDYFARHLQLQQTIKVGLMEAPRFGEDLDNVKRILQIKVNHGINVDGLQVTYELTNGQRKEMPWVGSRRGEYNDTVGPLDFDEDIASIEAGAKTLLRRVAFTTTKGRRFPNSPNDYYGRGESGELLTYTTIEAPRVCGIVGHSAVLVDSIGLRYRELAEGDNGPKSRNFLLEMEPYLFPSNIPSRIEMTVRGILRAGKWRTDEDLDRMTHDDKRNTLIVELGGHSNQDGNYFWGQSDESLVGMGAIVVFLLATGRRDRAWLKARSRAQHRDDVIELIHSALDEPLDALRPLSDAELVRWGFTIKSVAVARALLV